MKDLRDSNFVVSRTGHHGSVYMDASLRGVNSIQDASFRVPVAIPHKAENAGRGIPICELEQLRRSSQSCRVCEQDYGHEQCMVYKCLRCKKCTTRMVRGNG